jgi:hypothetical protein
MPRRINRSFGPPSGNLPISAARSGQLLSSMISMLRTATAAATGWPPGVDLHHLLLLGGLAEENAVAHHGGGVGG